MPPITDLANPSQQVITGAANEAVKKVVGLRKRSKPGNSGRKSPKEKWISLNKNKFIFNN